MSFGAFTNLSAWGVRWLAGRDRELEIIMREGGETPWFFRHIPLQNLYDFSIAFAFGAGITTLFIARRRSFSFLGALSLPLLSLILLLAIFIGDEFINLPPSLDSYWRPIHVGTASLSYGVALVCFAVGVLYLLKDGVRPEAMAITSSIFAIGVIGSISNFSVFTTGIYSASTILGNDQMRMPTPLRVDLPYVGALLALSGALLAGVIALFGFYLSRGTEALRTWGHRLLKLSLVAQAAAIAAYISQVKTIKDVLALNMDTAQFARVGAWVAQNAMGMRSDQVMQLGVSERIAIATGFVQDNGRLLNLSLKANPVELSALITCFAATLFVILFSFRTEQIRQALPSLERLDSLMYKTAGVTFALLAVLLITGAIWANESWGRPWGWDPKETGAFVAWLTYGIYLHTRIARGWTGRRSAYFALVGFLFVLFTYLGVSYLLPGLHSYA
jgi:cytochrome c-type biogenesis protein CcsB